MFVLHPSMPLTQRRHLPVLLSWFNQAVALERRLGRQYAAGLDVASILSDLDTLHPDKPQEADTEVLQKDQQAEETSHDLFHPVKDCTSGFRGCTSGLRPKVCKGADH